MAKDAVPKDQAQQDPEGQPKKWSFKYEDTDFTDPKELTEYIRLGTLMQNSYTQKTQAISALRTQTQTVQKELEQAKQALEKERQVFEQEKGEIQQYRTFLAQNPQITNRIRTEMSGQGYPAMAQPQTQAPDLASFRQELLGEIQQMIQPLTEFRETETERRGAEDAKNTAYEALKALYPDFDAEVVDKAFTQLTDAPEGDEVRQLAETLYYAQKARDPTAPPAPTPGASPLSSDAEVSDNGQEAVAHKSIADAREAARVDLGLSDDNFTEE